MNLVFSLYTGVRSKATPGCSYSGRPPISPSINHMYKLSRRRRGSQLTARRSQLIVTAAQRDPYEILGVPRNADLKQIKQAFKKKALKLHPDVNKAPDAKERFMECKVAYQTLSDAKERARFDRGGAGGSGAGFSWDDVVTSGQRSRQAAEEAFYGLGDFFRDLDKDISERRQRRKGKTQPLSLWEELSEIGEEFVEFLEKEIGLAQPKERGSANDERPEADAAEARRQAAEAEERARRAAATAQDSAKKVNNEIEDMLQQMKKDLGIR